MNKCYVYAYLDPRKPGIYEYEKYLFNYEPFYIGKGSYDRIMDHIWETNTRKTKNKIKFNKIKKIKEKTGLRPIIIKVENNLSEQEAFNIEITLIKLIGRIDLRTGPLVNLTNGGDGLLGKKFTDDHKRKIAIAQTGEKNHMYGKKLTEEHKRKMSIALKGKIFTEENKRKLSILKKGIKRSKSTIEKIKRNHADVSGSKNPRSLIWKIISPINEKFIVNYGLCNFLYNGKKIFKCIPAIRKLDNDGYTLTNGWKIKNIKEIEYALL